MGHVRRDDTIGTSTDEKGNVMIMDDDFFDWFNEIERPSVGHIGEPNNETNGAIVAMLQEHVIDFEAHLRLDQAVAVSCGEGAVRVARRFRVLGCRVVRHEQ